jgi:hypothetical protein
MGEYKPTLNIQNETLNEEERAGDEPEEEVKPKL